MTDLTVLSLGAGVQSTTLGLLAVEGTIPKPDIAIFADTGWEPQTVYDHLARLTERLEAAGIPVVTVQKGNLRDDALNPDRPIKVPAFVKNPDGSQGKQGRSCTDHYKLRPIHTHVRGLLGGQQRDAGDCRWCDGTGQRVAPWRARRGDQDAITTSIRDLGLYRTVIAQRTTGHILAGNHTLRALLDLGADRVPVTWVDVDDTRAAAIVARDNHTSDLARNDDAELLALLTADEDVLALSGMDDDVLTVLRRAVENQEFAASAGQPGEPVGDVSPPIDVGGDTERVTVTDRDRFLAADAALRQGVQDAVSAKRTWDAEKITRRAGGTP